MNYYYADANNQPAGPHSLEDLIQMYSSGAISGDTYVIEESGTEWKEFSSIHPQAAPQPQPQQTPLVSQPSPAAQLAPASPVVADPAGGRSRKSIYIAIGAAVMVVAVLAVVAASVLTSKRKSAPTPGQPTAQRKEATQPENPPKKTSVAATDQTPTKPGQQAAFTDTVPSGAVAVIEYAGSETLAPAYQKSVLGQILGDSQVQAFLQKPKEWIYHQIEKQPDAPKSETAKRLVALLTSKESVVGIYAGQNAGVVWSVRLGKDEAEARKLLDEVGKSNPMASAMAVTNGTLVLATNPGLSEQSLGKLSGANAGGDGSKRPALVSGESIGWAKVDFNGLRQAILESVSQVEERGRFEGAMRAFGLDGIGTAELAVSFDGPAIRSGFHATTTKPPSGLLKAFTSFVPLDEKAIKVVPKEVVSASVASWNAPALWTSAMDAIESIGGSQATAEFQKGLAEFEQQVQFKVKDDLIGSLGDTITFYARPSAAGASPIGDIVILLAIKDNKRMTACLEALAAFAEKQKMPIKQSKSGDSQVYYFAGMPGVMPALTVKGGYLYITASLLSLNAAIDQVEKPQTSLLDNDDFRQSRAKLPDKVISLSYEDTRQSVASLYQAIGTFGPMLAGQEDAPIDMALLPPLSVVQSKLFGSVGVVTADAQGIALQFYSPFGMSLSANAGSTGVMAGMLRRPLREIPRQARRPRSQLHE